MLNLTNKYYSYQVVFRNLRFIKEMGDFMLKAALFFFLIASNIIVTSSSSFESRSTRGNNKRKTTIIIITTIILIIMINGVVCYIAYNHRALRRQS